MPARPSFLFSVLTRALRFFYLLWGGMLLTSLAAYNRLRPPAYLWKWPDLARFFLTPWGRGLCLGIGLAMAIGALQEVWYLVDMLLVHFLPESEREHR